MTGSAPNRRSVHDIVRENGLLLACVGLFAVFFVGMIVSGAATYNEEQLEHGSHEQLSVLQYLTTGRLRRGDVRELGI